jgi:DNA repair ATPase RecN
MAGETRYLVAQLTEATDIWISRIKATLRTAEQVNGKLQHTIIKSLETFETAQSNMDKTAQRLATSETLNRELQNNLIKSINIIETAQSKLNELSDHIARSEKLNSKLQVKSTQVQRNCWRQSNSLRGSKITAGRRNESFRCHVHGSL